MQLSTAELEVAFLVMVVPLVYILGKCILKSWATSLFREIPIVGFRDGLLSRAQATCRSLWKTAEWAAEGYAKFSKHNSPYLISTLDRGLVVLLPVIQMKTVYRLPEDRLDIFGTLNEQIQAKYTIRNQKVIRDPYHRHLIPSELDIFTEPMVNELEKGLESLWGTETGWREIPIWQSCFQLVARATNYALCGIPLCRDENYLKYLQVQSTAVFGGSMLISITPKPLRMFTGRLVRWWCLYYSRKINSICAPYIGKRIDETIHMKDGNNSGTGCPKDGLQLIIDETTSRGEPLAVGVIAERLLIANNVSIHSTTLTVHNLIMSLVTSDPSSGYIEALREECRDVLSSAGGIWTLDAVRKLKLVDSAIRESMRVFPFASVAMARTVVDPQGISIEHGDSSVHVPQGTTLALPMESIHYDEDTYPDASRFNPFRFTSEDTGSTTAKPTTTADDKFLSFGTSRNPCPGRFLAVHEMKLIVASMLLNYDIEYTKTKLDFTNLLAMKVPNTGITLRVRRRPDLKEHYRPSPT
ncbi:cytochrome P450 [Whalleya microplaca]|nr:cytochrome P450 [Whalleya microplaca]